MATVTVTVTKQFKEDFDLWANQAMACGDFTKSEMEELRKMLRQDFTPGPDQLRGGLTHINAAGIEVPSMIDDYQERIRVWTNFFADKAKMLRGGRMAA